MGSAYIKIVLRSIKGSIVRFAAILAIIALGVGFFAGLKVTKPSFIETADKYTREQKLFDFRLISTIGFDDDDISKISALDGVTACEGAYWADAVISRMDMPDHAVEEDMTVVRFHTLTDGINVPLLESGRLPVNGSEVLIDAYSCPESFIGDKIVIRRENSDEIKDNFTYDEYLIVGTIRSPYYMNFQRGTSDVGNGSVGFYVYVPEDGLDFEYYSEAYIYMDTGLYIYSDEYDDFIDSEEDILEPQIQGILNERMDEIISDAEDEIYDGAEELRDEGGDASIELWDARTDLSDAFFELKDAAIEIEDGQAEIDDAEDELSDAWSELASAKEDLDTLKETIDEVQAGLDEINDGLSQLEIGVSASETGLPAAQNAVAELTATLEDLNAQKTALEAQILTIDTSTAEGMLAYGTAQAQLAAINAGIDTATGALNTAQSSIEDMTTILANYDYLVEQKSQAEAFLEEYQPIYDSGMSDYNEGLSEYYGYVDDLDEAREELADGITEYEDGMNDYLDGLNEYVDGRETFNAEMMKAANELSYAKAQIDSLEEPEIYMLGRDTNVGYVCFENDAEIVDDVAKVFPLFFFAIAALVCSTTMQRMVAEERTQIGTMRAMGYSKTAIVMKYVIYSGAAAMIGCGLGFAGGTRLFPYVIWQVYGMMYGFAPLTFKNSAVFLIISLVVSVLCSVGATILSCVDEFNEMPAELVRPKAPVAGKRILLERMTFIWKKLSFLVKVSARNVFRFKRRMWMMIIGIAGCTALVITGFGLQDSIKNVVNFQYDEIMTYDISINFDEKTDRWKMADIISAADAKWNTTSEVTYADMINVRHNGEDLIRDVEMIASDDPNITNFVNPHADGVELPWPGNGGVAISSKLAKANDFKIGDTIVFEYGDEGKTFSLTIESVFENYIFHYALVDAKTFEEATGEKFTPTYVLINLPSEGRDGFTDYEYAGSIAQDSKEVVSWAAISENRVRFTETMNQLNLVVVLVIACAAMLAFIVLFNLNNINISERVREIATLKVLGFNRSETGSYVFRENFVLVLIGFIFGVPLGILLHRFVMSQIQMDMVTFQIQILPISYLYSLLMVLLFSLIVDLFMRGKIMRIDMAESLKSIE